MTERAESNGGITDVSGIAESDFQNGDVADNWSGDGGDEEKDGSDEDKNLSRLCQYSVENVVIPELRTYNTDPVKPTKHNCGCAELYFGEEEVGY